MHPDFIIKKFNKEGVESLTTAGTEFIAAFVTVAIIS